MSNFNQHDNDKAAHAAALETSQLSLRASGINPQAVVSYTLKATDVGPYLPLSNPAPIALIVPPNSAVPIEISSEIEFEQSGAGIVTVTPGAGVTINSRGGIMTTAGQFAVGSLRKTGPDTWTLTGDLA